MFEHHFFLAFGKKQQLNNKKVDRHCFLAPINNFKLSLNRTEMLFRSFTLTKSAAGMKTA